MDARGAPQRIVLVHLPDQFAQLTADPWPSRPAARFPAPIGPKTHPMPPQDRVGLNDARQIEQVRPKPSHPYQRCPVNSTQPQTVRGPPHANIELMTEKKVLDFKLTPRLEQVGNVNANQLDETEHRI